MSRTFTKLTYHIIYSTKHRAPLIADAWRDDLHGYIGGVARNRGCILLQAGSVADHIHLLAGIPPKVAVADFVRDVKCNSTTWVKEMGFCDEVFSWQDGYGAFTVSQSVIPETRVYLSNQAAHHRRVSFKDEVRAFMRAHELEIDERHHWD